jgi:hypothetical protein
MKGLLVAGCAGAIASMTACGDCAGVGLSRIAVTEETIAVGASFVAAYEEGGSCSNDVWSPSPQSVRWTSAETAIVEVDSVTGRVTGKRVGDALVVPNLDVSTGPRSILIHVR